MCCGVLWWEETEKKFHNPFQCLAYIYWTKTHERFKHTTQQRKRAGADQVLTVSPLYTKYSRSWNSICVPSITSRSGLKISVCIWGPDNQLTLLAASIEWMDAIDSHHRIGISNRSVVALKLIFSPYTVSLLRLCMLMLLHSWDFHWGQKAVGCRL